MVVSVAPALVGSLTDFVNSFDIDSVIPIIKNLSFKKRT